jgi:hypothetical protein
MPSKDSQFVFQTMDDTAPTDMDGDAPAFERRLADSGMRPPAFIKLVAAEVVSKAMAAKEPLHHEARWRLAKFWYGPDSSVHYELALHENTSQLEIGLHAEASAERNRALYGAFDKCLLDIQKELGTSMWLEEWDRGWVRLYETYPLWPLDTPRVSEVAERVWEVMAVLQPIYETICDTLGLELVPAPRATRGR